MARRKRSPKKKPIAKTQNPVEKKKPVSKRKPRVSSDHFLKSAQIRRMYAKKAPYRLNVSENALEAMRDIADGMLSKYASVIEKSLAKEHRKTVLPRDIENALHMTGVENFDFPKFIRSCRSRGKKVRFENKAPREMLQLQSAFQSHRKMQPCMNITSQPLKTALQSYLGDTRVSREALKMLQYALQQSIQKIFDSADKLARLNNRKTIMTKDIMGLSEIWKQGRSLPDTYTVFQPSEPKKRIRKSSKKVPSSKNKQGPIIDAWADTHHDEDIDEDTDVYYHVSNMGGWHHHEEDYDDEEDDFVNEAGKRHKKTRHYYEDEDEY